MISLNQEETASMVALDVYLNATFLRNILRKEEQGYAAGDDKAEQCSWNYQGTYYITWEYDVDGDVDAREPCGLYLYTHRGDGLPLASARVATDFADDEPDDMSRIRVACLTLINAMERRAQEPTTLPHLTGDASDASDYELEMEQDGVPPREPGAPIQRALL